MLRYCLNYCSKVRLHSQAAITCSVAVKPEPNVFWTSRPLRFVNVIKEKHLLNAEVNWVRNFNSLKLVKSVQKINSYGLVGRVFEDRTDKEILTATKFFDFLFFFDDQFDDELNDVNIVEYESNKIYEIMKSNSYIQNDYEKYQKQPDCGAIFADFYQSVSQTYRSINEQFLFDFQGFCDGVKWAVANRNNSDISSGTYLKHRTYDVGVHSVLAVMYYLYPEFNDYIMHAFNDNDIIQEMKLLGAIHSALVNDILGVNKDKYENFNLNYVLLLHKEKQMQNKNQTLDDTVNDAIFICNNFFYRFIDLKNELKSQAWYRNHNKKHAVDSFINVYENWMNYHPDWMKNTERWAQYNR
eukprot:504167_1